MKHFIRLFVLVGLIASICGPPNIFAGENATTTTVAMAKKLLDFSVPAIVSPGANIATMSFDEANTGVLSVKQKIKPAALDFVYTKTFASIEPFDHSVATTRASEVAKKNGNVNVLKVLVGVLSFKTQAKFSSNLDTNAICSSYSDYFQSGV